MTPAKRQFGERYPAFLLEAVDWAMEMDPARRPRDAGELLRTLEQFANELPRSQSLESQSSTMASLDSDANPDEEVDSEPTRRI